MGDAGSVIGLDASDGVFVVILIAGVAILAVATLVFLRSGSDQPSRSNPAAETRAAEAEVCATGRDVIDLTALYSPDEPGTGLTVAQLSQIETKLDRLIVKIEGAASTARSQEAAQRLGLAKMHATSLRDAVQTERRLRLSSLTSDTQKLDTTALQIVSTRSELDDVLRQISKTIGETS